ncbi:hypothetical protein DIPPA_15387 [Diplonema papillatum]|nr:hypothetical protein DIPPA_15387 [Diplonema papillatum]
MGMESPPNRGKGKWHLLHKRLSKAKLEKALQLIDEISEIGVNCEGLASEIESCIHRSPRSHQPAPPTGGPNVARVHMNVDASLPPKPAAKPAPKPAPHPNGAALAQPPVSSLSHAHGQNHSHNHAHGPPAGGSAAELAWLPATTKAALGPSFSKIVEDLIDHLASQSFRINNSTTMSMSMNISLRMNPSLHPHAAMNPYALVRDWARERDWENNLKSDTLVRQNSKTMATLLKNRSPCISGSIQGSPKYTFEQAVKIVQRVGRAKASRRNLCRVKEKKDRHSQVDEKACIKQLVAVVNEMKRMSKETVELAQKGSPSDSDLRELQMKRHAFDNMKYNLNDVLVNLPDGYVLPVPTKHRHDMGELLTTLLYEGDEREGSKECVRTLLKYVDADFGSVMEAENLVAVQCGDGNIEFFRTLLAAVSPERYDSAEVLAAACYSQTGRIPLVMAALEFIDLVPVKDEVDSVLQEFFEDICCAARAIPKEIRTETHQLIRTMLTHPHITIDFTTTDGVGNTIFSRCCAEGDLLLYDILSLHARACIKPTEKLANDMTPLHQAVLHGHVDLVSLLVKIKNINLDVLANGTPLGIAVAMGRKGCEEILRKAGAKKVEYPELD